MQNKTIKKILFPFLLINLFLSINIEGQVDPVFTIPSPNSMSMLKFINIPVNNYTGIADINIPLLSLKSKDITVPIGLNYHTAGVKNLDNAGYVGLGWKMEAGGIISRIIRGLPDEDSNGYCGENNVSEAYNDPISTFSFCESCKLPSIVFDIENINDNKIDGQPDMFYFSFLGRSGKFVLNKNGDPIFLPNNNLKLEPAIGKKGIGKWILTDENGTKYYFGENENSKEKSTTEIIDETGENETRTFEGITSWYLTKIISSNGDEVNLTYSSNSSIILQQKFFSEKKNLLTNPCCSSIQDKSYNTSIQTTIEPKYIQQIICSSGSVLFTTEARLDISNYRLIKNIALIDGSNNTLKSFSLEYNYFDCVDAIGGGITGKKLKLKRIIDNTNNIQNILSEFFYNEKSPLASINSNNYDAWGYYNNAGTENPIPMVIDKYGIIHSGADRNVDENLSKLGILETIHNKGGGITELKYDNNDYYENGQRKLVGGLRISSIIKHSGSEQSDSKLSSFYSYNQSGQIYQNPKFSGYFEESDSECGLCENLMRASNSYVSLYDLNGVSIGYSHVTINSAGIEDFYYTNFSDFPDETPINYWSFMFIEPWYVWVGASQRWLYKLHFTNAYIDNDYPLFTSNTFKGWNRGLLLRHIIKKSNEEPLKEMYYYYHPESQIKERIRAINTAVMNRLAGTVYNSPHYGYIYEYGIYDILSMDRIKLEKKEEINYIQGKTITLLTEYEYNDKNLESKIKVSDPLGNEITSLIKYPTDLPSEPYMQQLVDNNRITDKILVTSSKNSKAIGTKKTIYKSENNLILPKEMQISNTDVNNLKSELIFDKYDSKGNILQTHQLRDNTKDFGYTAYLWGYNQSYPIAKIENSTYQNVLLGLTAVGKSEADLETISNGDNDEVDLLQLFNNLRNTTQMKDAIITSYTYDPLIGIRSETDASGKTNYYEYDGLGRLILVRNQNKEVLKKYDYYYKN